MTRLAEQDLEDGRTRSRAAAGHALELGLPSTLERQGIELTGLTLKYRGYDVLLIIKVLREGTPQVCFVGSDSAVNCLNKSVREAVAGRLHWRADRYAGPPS